MAGVVQSWSSSPLAPGGDLLMVLKKEGVSSSLLNLFRRVPLEKEVSDIPRVHQYRPIDIFSVIIRLHSSTLVAKLRGWLHSILFHTQYAMLGGAGRAVATCNMYAEATVMKLRPIFAVSLDYQKLFNSVSPMVAMRVAMYLGPIWRNGMQPGAPLDQFSGGVEASTQCHLPLGI